MKRIPRLVAISVMLITSVLVLSCAQPAPTVAPAPAPKAPAAPATPAAPGKPAPASPGKSLVTIATPWGAAASTAATQGIVLSALLKNHSPWVRSNTVMTNLAKGVEFWEKGKDQGVWALCFSQAMMAEYAKGIKSYAAQGPRKDQGILWPAYVLDIFWVSREGSPFKTMADVKGAKIALAEPGTSSFPTQKDILELALGFKETDYKPLYAAVADIVSLYKEGTVQVASWGSVSTKGMPYPYLEDMTSSVRSQFIPNTQAQVDKMNKALGSDLYYLHVIPAGIYRNQTADVAWVANITFATLPTMYSADIAYELTRTWWDYHDEGVEINSRVGQSEPEMAKSALKKKWDFDWHPGALKYYKEKGWI